MMDEQQLVDFFAEGRMTRIAVISSLALGAALVGLSPVASRAQQAPPTVEELKRVVEQREEELRTARVALAVARVRLAMTEGKAQSAAAECRTLLRSYEGRLKAVQELIAQGRLCSDEPLRQAQGSVAVARAWLAEAEGRPNDLLAELPKVLAYEEWRIQRYQSLREHKAISEHDARAVLKEAEADLRWARERLTALRGGPAKPCKTGTRGKP
jgi:hypothetical protein